MLVEFAKKRGDLKSVEVLRFFDGSDFRLPLSSHASQYLVSTILISDGIS